MQRFLVDAETQRNARETQRRQNSFPGLKLVTACWQSTPASPWRDCCVIPLHVILTTKYFSAPHLPLRLCVNKTSLAIAQFPARLRASLRSTDTPACKRFFWRRVAEQCERVAEKTKFISQTATRNCMLAILTCLAMERLLRHSVACDSDN